MVKVLHFADAHIDIASQGRHDPATGLPVRVLDFLKALDTIVDAAIAEKVDLVIFAGDAYKDRMPAPTYQREWEKRMIRLSTAHIPTLLLVGNHDVSPASGRAHTLQEFDTLEVPFIRVISKPEFLKPADLWGLPLQVLGLPWLFRSGLMAAFQDTGITPEKANEEIEIRITEILHTWMDQLDSDLPAILTAHGTVQGAVYGNERTVMLGKDLVLPGNLVKDPRLDYAALGHIHKYQDLSKGSHPPVVYSGSIERVDFGEAADEKYFIIANVEKGKTTFKPHKLDGRRFIDLSVVINANEKLMDKLYEVISVEEKMTDAILRLVVHYPKELETSLDETALREKCAKAFEFHLVRRPKEEARMRLPNDESIANLPHLELVKLYLATIKIEPGDMEPLLAEARDIIDTVNGDKEGIQ